MSAAETILFVAAWLGLALLVAAFLLTVWRVVRGPTLPDRVVALDMLVGIVIGFIALIAIRTGFTLYIDIAIALGLVGFLATVAFARFILASKRRQGGAGTPLEDAAPAPDTSHVAARGSRRKSAAKSAKVPAKTSAKKSPKSLRMAPSVAEPASPASAPAANAAMASTGKAAEEKPSAKSIDKPANKSASKTVSKSTSKTGSKSAEKTAGKATAKPGKPAKGE